MPWFVQQSSSICLRKLAGQGTHTCEVFFDDVRLGPEAVLGGVGNGARMVFELLGSWDEPMGPERLSAELDRMREAWLRHRPAPQLVP